MVRKYRYQAKLAEKYGVTAIVLEKDLGYRRDEFEHSMLEAHGYSKGPDGWYTKFTERNLMHLFKLSGGFGIRIDPELVGKYVEIIDKFCPGEE